MADHALVKYLTVYAFSIENFNRPAYEVEALMGLVLSFFKMQLFHNNNVSFHVVGDVERLPQSVQDKLRSMEEETAMYDVVNVWSAPTPFNARGGYSNIWWHFTDRYLRDDTENAVVFLMD